MQTDRSTQPSCELQRSMPVAVVEKPRLAGETMATNHAVMLRFVSGTRADRGRAH